jgi:hypothetical protein
MDCDPSAAGAAGAASDGSGAAPPQNLSEWLDFFTRDASHDIQNEIAQNYVTSFLPASTFKIIFPA